MRRPPFVISHKNLSSVLQKPAQLWTSLSPNRIRSRAPIKKALLIGINYQNARDREERLDGPHKDVHRVEALLIKQYGYNKDRIVILTDEENVPEDRQPTHVNIMRELNKFVEGQEQGDYFLVYYAGHGIQSTWRGDSMEEDGRDELIIPSDALGWNGQRKPELMISDDKLKEILVDPLLRKSHLTAIFDSCHSGTVLDLPHHRCNRVYTWNSRLRRIGRRVLELLSEVEKHRFSPAEIVKKTVDSKKTSSLPIKGRTMTCSGYCLRLKRANQNIICLSACKDSENAYESRDGSSMTTALIDLLERCPRPTLKETMRAVSSRPINGVKESSSPQLSSRHPLRMNSFLKL
ncbi:Metacaspase-1 [Hypsizygus marmoreus]|uniref:Metacaspase-1 n=1 Tax=Hypsizygus marmoreus TaxID=39966 RepID=A0A369JX90_HYPMA|nr:Metacaspase-1 [Hypsizygus marmoreus]